MRITEHSRRFSAMRIYRLQKMRRLDMSGSSRTSIQRNLSEEHLKIWPNQQESLTAKGRRISGEREAPSPHLKRKMGKLQWKLKGMRFSPICSVQHLPIISTARNIQSVLRRKKRPCLITSSPAFMKSRVKVR